MSTETPLTDADVARLVALADAANATRGVWMVHRPRVGRKSQFPEFDAFTAACDPATIKALAARLDALHADYEPRLRELTACTLEARSELVAVKAERDEEHVRVGEWMKAAGERRLEIDRLRAERDALREERDRWEGQAKEFLKAATEDLGRYHRLRDAITALADELTEAHEYDAQARLRALLSEAGEPNE